jgi:hypothetical protein
MMVTWGRGGEKEEWSLAAWFDRPAGSGREGMTISARLHQVSALRGAVPVTKQVPVPAP